MPKLDEIRRDVHRPFGAAMHAADPARREDAYAGARGYRHRRRDRCPAVHTLSDGRGEIAPTQLASLRPGLRIREAGDLSLRQSDMDAPLDNADRRWHRAAISDQSLAR